MKRPALILLVWAAVLSGFSQGSVYFNNFNPANGVSTRVFGAEPANPWFVKSGNRSDDTPPGTQIYTGAPLSGSNWRTELWGAAGTGVSEYVLLAGSPGTSFRTGTAVGIVAAVIVTFANIPPDFPGGGTFQMRVWDNSSGLYPTWSQAEVAWLSGVVIAIKSPLFNLNAPIGGTLNLPPFLVGLQSFNVPNAPEPSSFALLLLAGALWVCYRRRKQSS